jgi:sulfate transport system permease protein
MRKRHVLPGFGLSMGYTLLYMGLIVLIPMSALAMKTFSGSWEHFFRPSPIRAWWHRFR